MSESSPELKEMVISHFVQENGIARVVFCTEAFGMGLDCPDIAQVIHFSSAKTTEGYIQEVGRSGRDGQQARAILFNVPTHAHTSQEMRKYTTVKDTCRRTLLFTQMMGTITNKPVPACKCCDVCAAKCNCGQCCDFHTVIM